MKPLKCEHCGNKFNEHKKVKLEVGEFLMCPDIAHETYSPRGKK